MTPDSTLPGSPSRTDRLSSLIREQARACEQLGSPMYEQLLGRVADDVDSAGVFRDVLRGHEDDPGPSALALRVVGSLHYLVLDGLAPRLAPFYPSVGGHWDLEAAWPMVVQAVVEHRAAVRARLDQAPQTNEVGRSVALMGGLLHVVDRVRLPVRLLELGSSAGLNLRADQFFYGSDSRSAYGPADSPVRFDPAWTGRPVPMSDGGVRIVERLGCDVSPLDPTTADGELLLLSYIWPDMLERIERLRGAIELARAVPAVLRSQDARSFVDTITLAPDHVTVLWHSVMWQYLTTEDKQAVTDRIESLGRSAVTRRPFAHLFLEPQRRTPESEHEFLVVLQVWPGGDRRILGSARPHGPPAVWD